VKASLFYRIAAVLLLLFAVGHTLGFRQSDPTWGVDTLLGSMRSIHFDVQGFSRTYWDLFVAAGFSVGVFYLFAAVLAWQLGGLPAETLAVMRVTVWALALCFAAITVVSWRYLFILSYRFFNRDYSGMAFSEANLKPFVRVCSNLPGEPHPYSAWRFQSHFSGYLRIRTKIQALRICNALRERLVGKPSKTPFVRSIRPVQSNISGMFGAQSVFLV